MSILRLVVICISVIGVLSGYLTPEHVQQHIKRLISERYQLYTIKLGSTVNNNPLKAYVITGTSKITKGIKKQQGEISQLTNYPAALITSYMHPREPYSIKLIEKVLDDVLNNFNSDFYYKYMLDHTLLILFPFVNIDGYYQYQKLVDQGADKSIRQSYRKNMNKYGKCTNDWDYGVDINRNFDHAYGSLQSSQDQCGEQYRGPNAFSEKQSQAIRTLFRKFKITLAIDIHSYGNEWIYPYASEVTNDKLQSHSLYPIYVDLFSEFKKFNRTMKSCFETLRYTADGVFIDWALDKGALSFAVEVGKSFDGDSQIAAEILFQTEELFHVVLRKNSVSFKKFLTPKNQLVIISTSLIDVDLQISLLDSTVFQTKTLKSRKSLAYKLDKSISKVILKIKNSNYEEEITLAQLQGIDEVPLQGLQVGNSKIKKMTKIIVYGLSISGFGVLLYFICKRSQQKTKFSLPKQHQVVQSQLNLEQMPSDRSISF